MCCFAIVNNFPSSPVSLLSSFIIPISIFAATCLHRQPHRANHYSALFFSSSCSFLLHCLYVITRLPEAFLSYSIISLFLFRHISSIHHTLFLHISTLKIYFCLHLPVFVYLSVCLSIPVRSSTCLPLAVASHDHINNIMQITYQPIHYFIANDEPQYQSIHACKYHYLDIFLSIPVSVLHTWVVHY